MTSQTWMVSSACAALALGVMSSPACAAADQSQGGGATAATNADESRIADIVVTARRREESLQSTPIAITAVNSETLERRGIINMGDLSKITPNLYMYMQTAVLGSAGAAIRGIGASDNVIGQDSPIGLYIDGVAAGRLNNALTDMVEPDSVQVLRGPQGTLFGRNTTAGAILVQTHTPTDEFSGRVKASYGTYNNRQVSARVDSGLLGNTGIKLAFAYNHRQSDGTEDVLTLPSYKDPGSIQSESFFGKAVGEWGDFKATLTGDYSKLSGYPELLQMVGAIPSLAAYNANSPANGGTQIPISTQPLYTFPDYNYYVQTVSGKGLGLTLEYKVSPELTLKAIGGLRSYYRDDPSAVGSTIKGPIGGGAIGTFASFFEVPARNQQQNQRSLELQALGTMADFDYVVGLYYYNEKGHDFAETRLPFVSSGTLASVVDTFREYTINSTSKAAFTQVSWKPSFLDKKLEMTGGIRYTKDNRNFSQTRSIVRSVNLETGNTSYLASLSYQWTPDVMTYVKYSTGYRAGGFSVRSRPPADPVFRPEKIKAWEGGFKIDAFDRHLRLNFAAFHNKYTDLQVTSFSAPTAAAAGGTQNLNANGVFKGVEIEATVVPVNGLTLTGSWGYVDAKFTNYPIALVGGAVTPGCVGISGGGALLAQDCAPISDVANVPKSNIALTATYTLAQSYGEWLVSANYTHFSSIQNKQVDDTSTGLKALLQSPPYGLLGARIALSKIPLAGDNVTGQIALFGNNLLDEKVFYSGTDFGQFAAATPITRRTFGIEASVNF